MAFGSTSTGLVLVGNAWRSVPTGFSVSVGATTYSTISAFRAAGFETVGMVDAGSHLSPPIDVLTYTSLSSVAAFSAVEACRPSQGSFEASGGAGLDAALDILYTPVQKALVVPFAAASRDFGGRPILSSSRHVGACTAVL